MMQGGKHDIKKDVKKSGLPDIPGGCTDMSVPWRTQHAVWHQPVTGSTHCKRILAGFYERAVHRIFNFTDCCIAWHKHTGA